MRKQIAFIVALALALVFVPAHARAQSLPLDTNGNVKVTTQASVTVQQLNGANLHIICDGGCVGVTGWTYYQVPASTACVSPNWCLVKGAVGVFAGILNPSTAAQSTSNTCTIYDNTSGASGPALFAEAGIGAGQVVTINGGMKTTAGLVIQCSATPTGLGLIVLYN